jgi:hypothetical protein
LNSVAAAIPSKSIVDGKTVPSSLSELLKGVAHLPDPFTFTIVG